MPETENQRTTVAQSYPAPLEHSGNGAARGDLISASQRPSGDGAATVNIEPAPQEQPYNGAPGGDQADDEADEVHKEPAGLEYIKSIPGRLKMVEFVRIFSVLK